MFRLGIIIITIKPFYTEWFLYGKKSYFLYMFFHGQSFYFIG